MQTITALFDDYDDAADAVGELGVHGCADIGPQHHRQ